MPNWCRCELEVTGPSARVRAFLECASGEIDGAKTPLDFNRFTPYPPEWRELDRQFLRWLDAKDFSTEPPVHAYSAWGYQWCCDNWGTSGNARGATLSLEPERDGKLVASFEFLTPWSEPARLVLKASEMFPELHLTLYYFEPLGDFGGSFTCEAGRVTGDEWGPCTHEIIKRF